MKKKIETKRFEGLTAIVGNPGKGKTYFLQKLALEYLKKGYIVVLVNCGWSINGAIMIEEAEEILSIYVNPNQREERIAMFTDEANALFPARDWARTSKDNRDYFAMFRHAGVVAFYYCTQSFGDVENIVRSKTEFVWKCGFLRPLRLFYHRKYSKSDYEKMESGQIGKYAPYKVSLFFARKLKTNYDTYARYERVTQLSQQNIDIKKWLENVDEEKMKLKSKVKKGLLSKLKIIKKVDEALEKVS